MGSFSKSVSDFPSQCVILGVRVSLRPYTEIQAVLLGFKVVVVAATSSPDEFLALRGFRVVVDAGNQRLTLSYLRWQGAVVGWNINKSAWLIMLMHFTVSPSSSCALPNSVDDHAFPGIAICIVCIGSCADLFFSTPWKKAVENFLSSSIFLFPNNFINSYSMLTLFLFLYCGQNCKLFYLYI